MFKRLVQVLASVALLSSAVGCEDIGDMTMSFDGVCANESDAWANIVRGDKPFSSGGHLLIDPRFTQAEREQIGRAVMTWNDAIDEVDFEIIDPGIAPNDSIKLNRNEFMLARCHAGSAKFEHSEAIGIADTNGFRNVAVNIDAVASDCTLSYVTVHELGHLLGLSDTLRCSDDGCATRIDTVMGPCFEGASETPSGLDVAGVAFARTLLNVPPAGAPDLRRPV